MAYHLQVSRTWGAAIPNLHDGSRGQDNSGSIGPEMAFARTLINLGVSRKVRCAVVLCEELVLAFSHTCITGA